MFAVGNNSALGSFRNSRKIRSSQGRVKSDIALHYTLTHTHAQDMAVLCVSLSQPSRQSLPPLVEEEALRLLECSVSGVPLGHARLLLIPPTHRVASD